MPEPRPDGLRELLASAGLPPEARVTPLRGGRNNRVYRVDVAGGRCLLKHYYRHPADPRDRLGTEYDFLSLAQQVGLTAAPRPVARADTHALALYEWVDGRALTAAEVGADAVAQAMAFYRGLNTARAHPAASRLPAVSEPAFSLAEHLALVGRRIARLALLDPVEALRAEVSAFVDDGLTPTWERVAAQVQHQAGARLDQVVPPSERCLSPSDFGFHNALLQADGRLRLVDFEYAGWDEPARMVCDFFCQPDLPVPDECRPLVEAAAGAHLPHPGGFLERVRLLQPVYRLKWCCILLNDLLPVDANRRRFSGGTAPDVARQAEQLRRAQAMLARVEPL